MPSTTPDLRIPTGMSSSGGSAGCGAFDMLGALKPVGARATVSARDGAGPAGGAMGGGFLGSDGHIASKLLGGGGRRGGGGGKFQFGSKEVCDASSSGPDSGSGSIGGGIERSGNARPERGAAVGGAWSGGRGNCSASSSAISATSGLRSEGGTPNSGSLSCSAAR